MSFALTEVVLYRPLKQGAYIDFWFLNTDSYITYSLVFFRRFLSDMLGCISGRFWDGRIFGASVDVEDLPIRYIIEVI